MTVIVGLNAGDLTWLGADSAASDDSSIEARKEPKIWKDGHWVVGVSPSFRMAQLIQYTLSLDDSLPSPANCTTGYLVKELVPLLTALLHHEPCESEEGWKILLGGQGFLWCIQDDYAISEVEVSTAVGSGSEYALGALYAMYYPVPPNDRLEPCNQVYQACCAASKYSLSVEGPVTLLKSERSPRYETGKRSI